MPASYSKPIGGHFGLGDGETLIFLRGLGFGFGFGFTVGFALEVEGDFVDAAVDEDLAVLFDAVADGFTVDFEVGFVGAFVVAFAVVVGAGFLVAAFAELPDIAIANIRKIENFLNRAPI